MKRKNGKMPPLPKRPALPTPASKQLVPRDPLEIRKIAKQSEMLKAMHHTFGEIEKNLKMDPNYDIDDKNIELLRSYVVASIAAAE